MNRRAVRLIVAWLLERDVEQWVLDTACLVLVCADMDQWQPCLVLVNSHGEACVSWCLTPDSAYWVSQSAEKRGLPHFTVPVADILAAEMFMQLLEFECEPDYFEFEHPAPVDIVDCGTR